MAKFEKFPVIFAVSREFGMETGSHLTAHTTINSVFSQRFWERPCPDHWHILARQQQTAASILRAKEILHTDSLVHVDTCAS